VMTGKDAIGGKNILLDSCVVSIDGEHPPFAFVLIEGEAVASELPPAEHLGPRSLRADIIWEPCRPRRTESATPWKESSWSGLRSAKLSPAEALLTSV
jgi:hypothetical protein